MATVVVPGCAYIAKDEFEETKAELKSARGQVAELEQTNNDLQRMVVNQQKQIHTLMDLGDKRLDLLFHVDRIELGRYTGGIDTDGKDGHDAIKVFLRPLDKSGSAIKAAGSVKIQLFDLALDAKENLLVVYNWPVDKISDHWSSSAFTYHYSFECPWKDAPLHEEITVRVEFTDYLTGKTFTAQTVCKVTLPAPTTQTGE